MAGAGDFCMGRDEDFLVGISAGARISAWAWERVGIFALGGPGISA